MLKRQPTCWECFWTDNEFGICQNQHCIDGLTVNLQMWLNDLRTRGNRDSKRILLFAGISWLLDTRCKLQTRVIPAANRFFAFAICSCATNETCLCLATHLRLALEPPNCNICFFPSWKRPFCVVDVVCLGICRFPPSALLKGVYWVQTLYLLVPGSGV